MSRQILLTQNQFAIVDDKNYERLNQYKWYALWHKNTKSFYAVRMVRIGKGIRYKVYMAREILGLKRGDKRQADHIKHKTLDNRESKLRIVTNQQNQWNHKNPKGYCWDKNAKKYKACIKLNGKSVHLGCFDKAEEAHIAYLKAKKKYHNI